MDPLLWQQLPEDLREGVLVFLPLKSFFRFRSVCRNWNSLIYSSQFLQHWARANQGRFCKDTWLVRIHNGPGHFSMTLVSFDLMSGKCFSHPEPCLFSTSTFHNNQVAVAGGLICYNSKMEIPILGLGQSSTRLSPSQQSGIFVCNPMTQKRWQLPPVLVATPGPAFLYPRELEMVVDTRQSSEQMFRILVAGMSNLDTANTSPLTAVYDSGTDSWSVGDNWLTDMMKPMQLSRHSMGRLQYFCDKGIFYNYRQFACRDYSARYQVSDIFNSMANFAVAAYDVNDKVWRRVVCPTGRHDKIYPVQSHQGSRLLVITNGNNRIENSKEQPVSMPMIPELLAKVREDGGKPMIGTLYGPSHFQIWELIRSPHNQMDWKLHLAISTQYRSQLWAGFWCPWTFVDQAYMTDENTIWIFVTHNPQLECFQLGFSLVLVCDLIAKSLRWIKLKLSRPQQTSEPYESPHSKLFVFNPRLDCTHSKTTPCPTSLPTTYAS